MIHVIRYTLNRHFVRPTLAENNLAQLRDENVEKLAKVTDSGMNSSSGHEKGFEDPITGIVSLDSRLRPNS